MRTVIILGVVLSLILNSCEKEISPIASVTSNDISRDLFAKTDSVHYIIRLLHARVRFEIQNRTDSTAYFAHCGEKVIFVLQKKVNEGWVDFGGWGNPCLAVFSMGEKQIPKDSTYFDYVMISHEGTYRLLFPFSWQSNSYWTESLDSLYSNEFLTKKSEVSIWTYTQEFTHNLTGKHFSFAPKTSEISIKFLPDVDSVQFRNFRNRFNLGLRGSKLDTHNYAAFRISKHDTLSKIGPEIIQDPLVIDAVPTYIDKEGNDIFVDPEWFSVQFYDGASNEEIEKLLRMWGSSIVMKQNVEGLYIVRGNEAWSIFDDIRSRMEYLEVKYTEPLYYDF